MVTHDKRVDAYIQNAESFAQPILQTLRAVVHQGCPNAEETIKWGIPFFLYKGKILCWMASFKGHCAFGFWLGKKLKDTSGILEKETRSAMGHLGKITAVKELPPKKLLIAYIKEAMLLTDGKKGSAATKKIERKLEIPNWLITVLKKNKRAYSNFQEFSFAKQNDYVVWVTGAKTEVTRQKRMSTMLEWLAEGKSLNWRYEK